MIEFLYIKFLFLLILVIPMIFMIKKQNNGINKIFNMEVFNKIKLSNNGISSNIRAYLLIVSFVFMVIAFSRPYIKNGEIKVKSSFINMVVALDMSRSMFATDIYPTRFEFAKKKFIDMLENLKNTKVSLIGFTTQTFLISPLTQDFNSLKFLTKNLNTQSISLKGTDILNTLQTANDLMSNQTKKILFLLTDGSDKKDFTQEIKYAKAHNITVYIYNIATKKGGTIKIENGILKDKKGNIVIVKQNENIKQLALKTNGAYMNQTLKKDDIKALIDEIHTNFKPKEDTKSSIKDTKELFFIPLFISLIVLFVALFSLPIKKKG